MPINTNRRFLVLDRTNAAQKPACHGFSGPGMKGDSSPSFEGDHAEEGAKGFANYLAKRNPGQRFYLAEIVAVCVQYTEPAPPAQWTSIGDEGAGTGGAGGANQG